MEGDAESLHVQSTFMIKILQNKCDTIANDKLPKESNDNWLDVSDNTDAEKNEHNELPKSNKNESNEFQGKTCNKTNDEVLRKESISENAEILPVEFTSNSKTASKENNVQTTFNESAASSSDEEVLQTRFTVQDKNMVDEDNSNNSPISSERISDKDSIPENDADIKKSPPIIIQAIAYDETNAVIDFDNTKVNPEAKQSEVNNHLEITKTDMTSGNSLSVEADNSNIEIESSYMLNSIDNDNELIDFNNRKGRNEVLQQEMEPIITMNENNSFALDFGESNDISADIVVQNFLNGSFDVNTYQSEKSSRNIKKKDAVSEKKQVAKSKLSTEMVQKNKDVLELNNDNRRIYGLFTATDKAKQHNLNNSKNDDFDISHNKSMKSLKRKKSGRQTKDTKKARITGAKKSLKDVKVTPESPKETNLKSYSRFENKLSNIKNHRKPVNNRLFHLDENNMTILNNSKQKNEDVKKNKTKTNIARKNSNKEEKMSSAELYNNNLVRNSRKKRNSSLIASRKIKEIEKLENSESCEEICLDSDDEVYVDSDYTYFVANNVKKKVDKYTNMLGSGKTNYRYQIENKQQSDKFWNKNTSGITSSDSLQSYSARREKIESSNRKYKNMFKDAFDACRITVKSPLKENDTEITHKYFTSDTNFSDDYFMQKNEDLYRNLCSSRKKVNKRGHSKDNESVENKMLDMSKNRIAKTASRKSNMQSIITYKGAVTRSKQKTWDMLEKELLGELNDTSVTNNVCKTVILKKEKLVRRQNIKDADLYTISNRSMMQTISKSPKGKKYNMQYEIQNTESKYLETTANSAPKEITSGKSKNTAILERAIAAMERCTAQFIEPQVNVIEKDQKLKALQFEDMFDNSDINQDAHFHSNIMTVMRNENEQYYNNEIVDYLKKSTKRKKRNIRLSKKSNLSKKVHNFSDGDCEYGTFIDAEHLEKNSFVIKSNLLKNKANINLKNGGQAQISSSGENHINPWNKLIRELNLEQNNEDSTYPKDISNNEESRRKPVRKSLVYQNNSGRSIHTSQNRNDKMLVKMDFDVEVNKHDKMSDTESEVVSTFIPNKETESLANHTPLSCNFNAAHSYTQMMITMDFDEEEINKQDKINDIESEQEVDKLIPNKETELLVNCTSASSNFNLTNSYSLNTDSGSRRNIDKRSKSDTEYVIRNLEKPVEKMEKNERKVTQIQKGKKVPKFKLQIVNDGDLKFKRHSSRSSTVTNSSEEFEKSKQNNIKHLKNNEYPKDKSNKSREKYKKYLKNLFNTEDTVLKEGMTSDHDRIKSMGVENKDKENVVKGKNKNQRKTKRKLIAENDEDIFSLSSSDSEMDNDKNQGSGLLCELFDE